MDTFSPQFAAMWSAPAAPKKDERVPAPSPDATAKTQEIALEELAERINAARSIL